MAYKNPEDLKAYRIRYYKDNIDMMKARNLKTYLSYENDSEKYIRRRVMRQKSSAKKRGIEWTLNTDKMIKKMIEQKVCACSGIEFEYKHNSLYSPSIDRKNSSKGYSPRNVQIVCTAVNLAKWKLTQKQFIDMCKRIAKQVA